MSILGIDPSLTMTGYCLLRSSEREIKVLEIGLATAYSNFVPAEEDRLMMLIDKIEAVLDKLPTEINKTLVVIEKPSGIVYGAGKMSRQAGIGKASKIFKLYMAYGALTAAIRLKGFTCHPVLPSEWEKPIRRKGQSIKKLSLALANERIANQFIRYGASTVSNIVLKTRLDENIADAINIAWHTATLLQSNKKVTG